MSTTAPPCPECGTPAGTGDRFCEQCGAVLSVAASTPPPTAAPTPASTSVPTAALAPTPRTCRECGGDVDVDGYCTQCGAKAASERDHLVSQPRPWVAAVSDRGRRHRRNEDAVAVRAGPAGQGALVVCDGVSSSPGSDVASLAAARAAARTIGTGSTGLATGSSAEASLEARVRAGASAASDAVAAVSTGDEPSPPSCTLVAAAVQASVVVVGVVGDSRAYWLPDTGAPQLLTEDDSVAGRLIAAGRPRVEAESGPDGHAITRWIGVDSPDETPRLTTLEVTSPGWLLLCSDGLWNYCSEPTAVGAALAAAVAATGEDPLGTAEALVSWANAQGGHDNITVALARILGLGPGASEGEADEG